MLYNVLFSHILLKAVLCGDTHSRAASPRRRCSRMSGSVAAPFRSTQIVAQ
jgi:hypothetical protein